MFRCSCLFSFNFLTILGRPRHPRRPYETSRCVAPKIVSPLSCDTFFALQLPSPKLSLELPPRMSVTYKRGLQCRFQSNPAVRVIARQLRDRIVPRQFGVLQGKTHQKARIFYLHQNPPNLWKRRAKRSNNQGNRQMGKKQGNPPKRPIGNVPSATTTESLIWWIIRCYIQSLFSTSQYRSVTTPGEFRCYSRCRFELLLLLLFRWC